jgi:alpha-tubulin suppressor-like RCC1 family protein
MENVASVSGRFAITTDGALWMIGTDEPTWVMDDVAYATEFNETNFVVTKDGTLLAWGINRLPTQWREGPILGDGTTVDRETPVKILENIQSVKIMGNNAYAIANDGILWTWGTGTTASLYGFDDDIWEYAYDDNGFPSGKRWLLDDAADTGIRLSPVQILEDVIYVSPTYYMLDHGWIYGYRTFALTNCGAVWAWGENDRFNMGVSFLGDGTSEYRLSPVRIIDGQ